MSPLAFKQKVLNVVKKIPKGKVLSYKEVAGKAGSPRAYRAVASIMSKNTDKTVPCHRVIRSDGSFGAYNKLKGKSKEEVLKKEKGGR